MVPVGEERPRVSFRVDPDIKRQLDGEKNLNTSGLMRSLLESYLLTGDAVEVGLERRLNDTENELERKRLEKTRLESDIEKLEREIEQLEKKIDERRQQTPEEVIEYAERVRSGEFDEEQLDPANPAAKNWANKAGLHPEAFVEEVRDRL